MSEQIEQRTEAWFAQRAGKITASRFIDVISVTKAGKPTAARERYMREIVFERLSGTPKHSVGALSLRWGTDVEQFAREAYEVESGDVVTETGFVTHPDYPFIGGSCDGLIGEDGIIEIKCPHDEQVHIETWLNGMSPDHRPQVQGNLLVTGRKYAVFISYDPRQNERFRLYHQRVERDEEFIQEVLLPGLLQFEAEANAMIDRLERIAS
ncbi:MULTISPECIES: lambda exonuclease family protein [unclassified Caballeronia]|uniref:lambda exonuclease family protein n=1 Tax=unclassified Caballeronia TaxID=2646786 RepID=UPI002028148C|nr:MULTISPECIES: lambda exonuclease family protein [unclassified Caballeronia]